MTFDHIDIFLIGALVGSFCSTLYHLLRSKPVQPKPAKQNDSKNNHHDIYGMLLSGQHPPNQLPVQERKRLE